MIETEPRLVENAPDRRSHTRIEVGLGGPQGRVSLRGGLIVPRLVSRTATSARVALAAGGALLLGGDHVSIDVLVGTGCVLEIEDVGGTVAYDADGLASSWSTRIVVESGARLAWHGLPLVVSRGAHVERSTTIELGMGAEALIRETIVWGRSGETGGRLASSTIASIAGAPLLVESLDAAGSGPEPGIIGGERVLDSVLSLGLRRSGLTARPGLTVLELHGEGTIARHLGRSPHASTLTDVWSSWARS